MLVLGKALFLGGAWIGFDWVWIEGDRGVGGNVCICSGP